jgi:hypothetical protein
MFSSCIEPNEKFYFAAIFKLPASIDAVAGDDAKVVTLEAFQLRGRQYQSVPFQADAFATSASIASDAFAAPSLPQQRINRTRPTIDRARRTKSYDHIQTSQRHVDDILQHRAAWTGAASFPMDDPHATQSCHHGFGQKAFQYSCAVVGIETVQVDLGVNGIFAVAKFAQHRRRDVIATKSKFIASLDGGRVNREAFPQHGLLIGAAKTCARLSLRCTVGSRLFFQTTDAAHRIAKQFVVV